MVSDHPEIAELDINPLIVYPEGKGCVVADSRILLTRVSESHPDKDEAWCDETAGQLLLPAS